MAPILEPNRGKADERSRINPQFTHQRAQVNGEPLQTSSMSAEVFVSDQIMQVVLI